MKIVLIGMPGSGKSTLGKKISNAFGMSFIDSDEYIENKYRTDIPTLFQKYGETAFRKLEHEVLKEILPLDNFILATGGGLPCFNGNMELIKQSAVSVYLKVPVKMLLQRLIAAKKKRPLTIGKNSDELFEYLQKTFSEREQCYQSAQYTFDTLTENPIHFFDKIINKKNI
jgi:shikimate kinase